MLTTVKELTRQSEATELCYAIDRKRLAKVKMYVVQEDEPQIPITVVTQGYALTKEAETFLYVTRVQALHMRFGIQQVALMHLN